MKVECLLPRALHFSLVRENKEAGSEDNSNLSMQDNLLLISISYTMTDHAVTNGRNLYARWLKGSCINDAQASQRFSS